MKKTLFSFLALVVLSVLPFSTQAASTEEIVRSSAEVTRSSSEVHREWVVGTSSVATNEVVRTVTVVVPQEVEKEKRVGEVHEEEYLHASAPMPVVLNKTGMEGSLFAFFIAFLLTAGGIALFRRKAL